MDELLVKLFVKTYGTMYSDKTTLNPKDIPWREAIEVHRAATELGHKYNGTMLPSVVVIRRISGEFIERGRWAEVMDKLEELTGKQVHVADSDNCLINIGSLHHAGGPMHTVGEGYFNATHVYGIADIGEEHWIMTSEYKDYS